MLDQVVKCQQHLSGIESGDQKGGVVEVQVEVMQVVEMLEESGKSDLRWEVLGQRSQ